MRIDEMMTKVRCGRYTIRTWTQVPSFRFGPDADVQVALRLLGDNPERRAITTALDAVPNMNAYELLDEDGNGALVYPDWP